MWWTPQQKDRTGQNGWMILLMIISTVGCAMITTVSAGEEVPMGGIVGPSNPIVLQECLQSCRFMFRTSVSIEEGCGSFRISDCFCATPFQDCKHGLEIGMDIGCRHRCSNPIPQWRLHLPQIRRAREAACKRSKARGETCDYGFNYAVLQIFERTFGTPLYETKYVHQEFGGDKNNTLTPYVKLPYEVPESPYGVIQYIYMELDEDPQNIASHFCASRKFNTSALEIQCLGDVQNGLQSRLMYESWDYDKKRVQLHLPIHINAQSVELVAYKNESADHVANSFCSDLQLPVHQQSHCYDRIIPILRQEFSMQEFN